MLMVIVIVLVAADRIEQSRGNALSNVVPTVSTVHHATMFDKPFLGQSYAHCVIGDS